MRISTTQMYQQGIASIQTQQAKLHDLELKLGSGLRIMKPSDDPSGAVKVLNLNANMEIVDQFSRNMGVAKSSLNFEESVISGVNDSLQRIRELVIQGNNSTYADNEKTSIGKEINQRLDELLALANTRDAAGEYIFGGNRVDSPPFVKNNGSITYQGDQAQRMVQVGQGAQVAIRDSGDAVFQSIPSGDGVIQVVSDSANKGTGLVGDFGVLDNFIPDDYTITFIQANATDPITYEVTDSALPVPNVVSTGTYQDNSSVSFAGAHFKLTGAPANGDTIRVTPSQPQDLFSTVKAIADALIRPANNVASKTQFHNEMGQGLANLDQALISMNNIRSGVGARLNNIDTIDGINQDFKLQLETVLSETQDLDYAEAISQFNIQLTSLQAAQQTFVKTAGLTLFQYL